MSNFDKWNKNKKLNNVWSLVDNNILCDTFVIAENIDHDVAQHIIKLHNQTLEVDERPTFGFRSTKNVN